MNDDRDTRGEDLSTSDGRTRPGQVDGRQFGSVPGDGATAGPEGGGFGGAPGQAPPRGNAVDEPRQGRRRSKRRPNMSWWVELPILLVFALVLALLIKSFVVQAFYIPSSSMENTLE